MEKDTAWKLPEWVTARRPRDDAAPTRRLRDEARWAIPYRLKLDTLVRAGLRCAYCGGQGGMRTAPDGRGWHVDHHIPLSRGGPIYDAVFSVVCGPCNSTKGSKTLDELRAWLLAAEETPHRLLMRAVLCG